jgi:hypothetical protein
MTSQRRIQIIAVVLFVVVAVVALQGLITPAGYTGGFEVAK